MAEPLLPFLGANLSQEEFDGLVSSYLIGGYGALTSGALKLSTERRWSIDQFSHVIGRVLVVTKSVDAR